MARGRHPVLTPSVPGNLEVPDPFALLTAAVVRLLLAEPHAEAFLEWMRRQAPRDHPAIFAGLPIPDTWPSYATTLGVGLWNAMPFPHNGFRPEPLPPQEASDPCRCRSGRQYARCCALLPSTSIPGFALWMPLMEQMDDPTRIAAAASLQMPANLLLELAQFWHGHQFYDLVLKLLEPVYRQLPKALAAAPRDKYEQPMREVLEPLTGIFVDSLMEVGGPVKERRWRQRLLAELPPELHGAVKVLGIAVV